MAGLRYTTRSRRRRRRGGALASSLTLVEFMERFVDYKQESGTIEPSTVRGYRVEAHTIARYIGEVSLGAVTIAFELGHAYPGRGSGGRGVMLAAICRWSVMAAPEWGKM